MTWKQWEKKEATYSHNLCCLLQLKKYIIYIKGKDADDKRMKMEKQDKPANTWMFV